jgi:hypothetical protein
MITAFQIISASDDVEENKRIYRMLRAAKMRNYFRTKLDAEIQIIAMGLPFKCDARETLFAF